MEVRGSRCDGSVVVISVALSINLNALTLEQVISKRRLVVLNMGEQMRVEVLDALVERTEWENALVFALLLLLVW